MEVGAAVVVNICTSSVGLDGERRATRTVSIQSKRAVLPLFFFQRTQNPSPRWRILDRRKVSTAGVYAVWCGCRWQTGSGITLLVGFKHTRCERIRGAANWLIVTRKRNHQLVRGGRRWPAASWRGCLVTNIVGYLGCWVAEVPGVTGCF